MPRLQRYVALLGRYRRMTHQEPWWDGRRERLAGEMDRAWEAMSEAERAAALDAARAAYEEGLAGP